MIYFIIDKNGKRGHPTKKGNMVTRKLKNDTAKIISRTKDSLTVKLLDKEFKDEDTVDAEFRIGIDPGANHIGIVLYKIFNNNITLLISGEADIRSTDVTKNLSECKMYRQNRRQHRRKNVKRKFGSVKFRKPIWKNRASKPFRPTHIHLINTHIHIVKYFLNRCPINKIHIEYNKFDTQKMINPGIHSWQYQRGESYGFENVKSYVRDRDKYICQTCKKDCLDNNEVHHIVSRSNGGSNKPSNLILLCPKCHKKVHTGKIKCPTIEPDKNLKQAGMLNSCMHIIFKKLENKIPTQDTYGYITKLVRHYNNLEKTHELDAQIIGLSDSIGMLDINNYNFIDLDNHINITQYRRHDRAWVARLEDRKYQDLQGKKQAINRRRKYSVKYKKDKNGNLIEVRKYQNSDSLECFRKKDLKTELRAKPGGLIYKRSNTKRRFKPGDLINYNGNIDICKGWASTQSKVILENYGYVKQKLCRVIRNNSGMVFI